ncbi:Nucleotide-binding alpha-beta plait [Penicillium fimorum]|uniref:Pre-rRNA-processing protein ESF2 n=1 Tax=Penicillium fimorum TaxID=1882269 RepID=A0A9X0C450_9EURO|nr:Nucleotide-binding alpha-beta plait [Penicillium fimorum]
MTTRKHNDFLDIAASDDEASGSDRGYDSEANVAESKGRAVKRRRTTTKQDFSVESGEDEDEDNKDLENESEDNEDEGGASLDDSAQPSTKSAKSLKAKGKLAKLSKLASGKAPKKTRSGVIYFSSLPPYLKPFALKAMLEKRGFGDITKIFLAPLLPSAAGNRNRSNKRKLYTEGWIEFRSKKTAKICAETLNATIVGGLKSSWYHDDVWNIKYLSRFTWDDLMQSVQRERSERESKRKIADAREAKEAKLFIEGVESGRIAEGMAKKNEEKMKRRLEAAGDGDGDKELPQPKKAAPSTRRRFHFQQNEVVKGSKDGAMADDAKRVLGKIF